MWRSSTHTKARPCDAEHSHDSQVSLAVSVTINDQEVMAGVWNMMLTKIFREQKRMRKDNGQQEKSKTHRQRLNCENDQIR